MLKKISICLYFLFRFWPIYSPFTMTQFIFPNLTSSILSAIWMTTESLLNRTELFLFPSDPEIASVKISRDQKCFCLLWQCCRNLKFYPTKKTQTPPWKGLQGLLIQLHTTLSSWRKNNQDMCFKIVIAKVWYSDPSLYRATTIAASLFCGIFYSAFFCSEFWLA